MGNFGQALETSKSNIFQAEIIALGRVAVTTPGPCDESHTRSLSGIFSGVKVVAFTVHDHCLEMELWAGGVASALPENLMSAVRMGWKLWHAQILGSLSPEKCLWCCPSRAAAVGRGSSSLCDELLMGCGMWESGKIKHYKEEHQSVMLWSVSSNGCFCFPLRYHSSVLALYS